MAKKLLELGKSLVSGTKGAIIPFDSTYIYRDYWSSIEGFSKNRFGDYSGMERKKGSRIPHPELKIVRKGNYCQVVTAKDVKDFYKKKLKKGQVVADNLIPFSDVPCNPFIAIPLGVEVKVPVKGKRYDVTELIMEKTKEGKVFSLSKLLKESKTKAGVYMAVPETQFCNIYFFSRNPAIYPYLQQNDDPYWLKGSDYWVWRYVWYWPTELTFPKPHEDYERVELWQNARTGIVEYATSDYHYRETWFKADDKYHPKIALGYWNWLFTAYEFEVNFHTPKPILSKERDRCIKQLQRLPSADKRLVSLTLGETSLSKQILEQMSKDPNLYKTAENRLVTFLDMKHTRTEVDLKSVFLDIKEKLRPVVAQFAKNLPWEFLRYIWGVERHDLYRDQKYGASDYP